MLTLHLTEPTKHFFFFGGGGVAYELGNYEDVSG